MRRNNHPRHLTSTHGQYQKGNQPVDESVIPRPDKIHSPTVVADSFLVSYHTIEDDLTRLYDYFQPWAGIHDRAIIKSNLSEISLVDENYEYIYHSNADALYENGVHERFWLDNPQYHPLFVYPGNHIGPGGLPSDANLLMIERENLQEDGVVFKKTIELTGKYCDRLTFSQVLQKSAECTQYTTPEGGALRVVGTENPGGDPTTSHNYVNGYIYGDRCLGSFPALTNPNTLHFGFRKYGTIGDIQFFNFVNATSIVAGVHPKTSEDVGDCGYTTLYDSWSDQPAAKGDLLLASNVSPVVSYAGVRRSAAAAVSLISSPRVYDRDTCGYVSTSLDLTQPDTSPITWLETLLKNEGVGSIATFSNGMYVLVIPENIGNHGGSWYGPDPRLEKVSPGSLNYVSPGAGDRNNCAQYIGKIDYNLDGEGDHTKMYGPGDEDYVAVDTPCTYTQRKAPANDFAFDFDFVDGRRVTNIYNTVDDDLRSIGHYLPLIGGVNTYRDYCPFSQKRESDFYGNGHHADVIYRDNSTGLVYSYKESAESAWFDVHRFLFSFGDLDDYRISVNTNLGVAGLQYGHSEVDPGDYVDDIWEAEKAALAGNPFVSLLLQRGGRYCWHARPWDLDKMWPVFTDAGGDMNTRVIGSSFPPGVVTTTIGEPVMCASIAKNWHEGIPSFSTNDGGVQITNESPETFSANTVNGSFVPHESYCTDVTYVEIGDVVGYQTWWGSAGYDDNGIKTLSSELSNRFTSKIVFSGDGLDNWFDRFGLDKLGQITNWPKDNIVTVDFPEGSRPKVNGAYLSIGVRVILQGDIVSRSAFNSDGQGGIEDDRAGSDPGMRLSLNVISAVVRAGGSRFVMTNMRTLRNGDFRELEEAGFSTTGPGYFSNVQIDAGEASISHSVLVDLQGLGDVLDAGGRSVIPLDMVHEIDGAGNEVLSNDYSLSGMPLEVEQIEISVGTETTAPYVLALDPSFDETPHLRWNPDTVLGTMEVMVACS